MNGLTRMLNFLAHLNRRKVPFTITRESDDGLLVSFALIGKRIEVEFFETHAAWCIFEGDESVDHELEPLLKLVDELSA